MTELRWALLLAGILFVAGLVFWELRKRRARDAERAGAAQSGGGGSSRELPPAAPSRAPEVSAKPAVRAEPAFSMPELSPREPLRDLPVVEIDPQATTDPRVGDLPVINMDAGSSPVMSSPQRATQTAEPVDKGATTHGVEAESAPDSEEAAAQSAALAEPDPVERASAWLADSVPNELPPSVVLDWPPEEQRRIIALRVVPRSGERFTGSALRQALIGEGFIHGELDIYHKPAGDGRAMISAASLTRPGTFDPKTIDGLLFAGLNLFAVLPGPLSPRDTFERLLRVARTLAQRLRGEVFDGRGQTLTDTRVVELRREAAEGTP
ncbi:MAG: hypothetical protein H7A18_09330 [Sinobacteraceae bacterium]|nr:hypothetical protein [Nevskiaceae bacterium]